MNVNGIPYGMGACDFTIPDPGASGAIANGKTGFVPLVSAAAETRTLAAPVKAGLLLIIQLDTDGGTVTLTITNAAESADGTVAFADAKDYIALYSIKVGSAFYWARVGKRLLASTDPAVGTALTVTNTELNLLSGLLATAAEINRAADVSTRIVSLAVSTAITEAAHDGKTIIMSGAGMARTFTLPAATGSGARFRFVVNEVNTSNYVIKSVAGADLMEGIIIGASTTDSATDAARTWIAGATDDTITLNGTTTGGVGIGDWIEVEDISSVGWAVRGFITQSGMEATPFSDSVA